MPDPRGVINQVRRSFWRAVGEGFSIEEAAAWVGVSETAGRVWFRKAGGMSSVCLKEPGGRRLSIRDREQIARGLAAGYSYAAIGRMIGRPTSTITREVRAHMRHRRTRQIGQWGPIAGIDWHRDWEYSPTRAQLRAERAAKRPKRTKLARCPRLAVEVQRRLDRQDSPEQIAGRLRMRLPDDPEMRVSHETIYQALYVQGRGELRRELHRQLRTGRALRRPARAAGGTPRADPGHGHASANGPPRSTTGPCPGTGKAT